MKKKLFLLVFFSFSVMAKDFSLGIIAGTPTGISGKYNLSSNRSIDGVVAYSLVDDLGLELHFDYLFEKVKTFSVGNVSPIEMYYGIGFRFVDITKGKHDGDVYVGPRFPLGVSYQVINPNVELFAEIAPAFDLIPATNLDLEAGVGGRIKFQ